MKFKRKIAPETKSQQRFITKKRLREDEINFDLPKAQHAYDDVIFHVNKRFKGQGYSDEKLELATALKVMKKLDDELAQVKTNKDMDTWIRKFKRQVANNFANDFFQSGNDVDTWLVRNGFRK